MEFQEHTDESLVSHAGTHLQHEGVASMEMQRRLIVAIRDFDSTSARQAELMIRLTWAIAVLTVVLAVWAVLQVWAPFRPEAVLSGREQPSRVMPGSAVEQLVLTGPSATAGSLSGTVYNGTNWKLNSIVLRVIAFNADGAPRWDRRFEVPVDISPRATGAFGANLGDREVASPMSGIVAASGTLLATEVAPATPDPQQPLAVAPRHLTHDEFQRVLQKVIENAPTGLTLEQLRALLNSETDKEETRLGISSNDKSK